MLVVVEIISDVLLFVAYTAISLQLAILEWQHGRGFPTELKVLLHLFQAFILLCGVSHLAMGSSLTSKIDSGMDNTVTAADYATMLTKLFAAIVSVFTAIRIQPIGAQLWVAVSSRIAAFAQAVKKQQALEAAADAQNLVVAYLGHEARGPLHVLTASIGFAQDAVKDASDALIPASRASMTRSGSVIQPRSLIASPTSVGARLLALQQMPGGSLHNTASGGDDTRLQPAAAFDDDLADGGSPSSASERRPSSGMQSVMNTDAVQLAGEASVMLTGASADLDVCHNAARDLTQLVSSVLDFSLLRTGRLLLTPGLISVRQLVLLASKRIAHSAQVPVLVLVDDRTSRAAGLTVRSRSGEYDTPAHASRSEEGAAGDTPVLIARNSGSQSDDASSAKDYLGTAGMTSVPDIIVSDAARLDQALSWAARAAASFTTTGFIGILASVESARFEDVNALATFEAEGVTSATSGTTRDMRAEAASTTNTLDRSGGGGGGGASDSDRASAGGSGSGSDASNSGVGGRGKTRGGSGSERVSRWRSRDRVQRITALPPPPQYPVMPPALRSWFDTELAYDNDERRLFALAAAAAPSTLLPNHALHTAVIVPEGATVSQPTTQAGTALLAHASTQAAGVSSQPISPGTSASFTDLTSHLHSGRADAIHGAISGDSRTSTATSNVTGTATGPGSGPGSIHALPQRTTAQSELGSSAVGSVRLPQRRISATGASPRAAIIPLTDSAVSTAPMATTTRVDVALPASATTPAPLITAGVVRIASGTPSTLSSPSRPTVNTGAAESLSRPAPHAAADATDAAIDSPSVAHHDTTAMTRPQPLGANVTLRPLPTASLSPSASGTGNSFVLSTNASNLPPPGSSAAALAPHLPPRRQQPPTMASISPGHLSHSGHSTRSGTGSGSGNDTIAASLEGAPPQGRLPGRTPSAARKQASGGSTSGSVSAAALARMSLSDILLSGNTPFEKTAAKRRSKQSRMAKTAELQSLMEEDELGAPRPRTAVSKSSAHPHRASGSVASPTAKRASSKSPTSAHTSTGEDNTSSGNVSQPSDTGHAHNESGAALTAGIAAAARPQYRSSRVACDGMHSLSSEGEALSLGVPPWEGMEESAIRMRPHLVLRVVDTGASISSVLPASQVPSPTASSAMDVGGGGQGHDDEGVFSDPTNPPVSHAGAGMSRRTSMDPPGNHGSDMGAAVLTATAQHRTTGLGQSLTRELIALMGGFVVQKQLRSATAAGFLRPWRAGLTACMASAGARAATIEASLRPRSLAVLEIWLPLDVISHPSWSSFVQRAQERLSMARMLDDLAASRSHSGESQEQIAVQHHHSLDTPLGVPAAAAAAATAATATGGAQLSTGGDSGTSSAPSGGVSAIQPFLQAGEMPVLTAFSEQAPASILPTALRASSSTHAPTPELQAGSAASSFRLSTSSPKTRDAGDTCMDSPFGGFSVTSTGSKDPMGSISPAAKHFTGMDKTADPDVTAALAASPTGTMRGLDVPETASISGSGSKGTGTTSTGASGESSLKPAIQSDEADPAAPIAGAAAGVDGTTEAAAAAVGGKDGDGDGDGTTIATMKSMQRQQAAAQRRERREARKLRQRPDPASASASSGRPPIASSAANGRASRPGRAKPGRGMHVLFVDDDSVVRGTTERMLTRLGARVTVLNDGAEVIPWLRANGVLPKHEHSPAPAPAPTPDAEGDATAAVPMVIDLVLSDIVMPGLDGESLCARLADLDLRIPVVAATGTAAPEALRRFPESGFAGVLCKPYVVEQLAQVINGVKQNAFNPPKDVRDRRRSSRRR